jgi:hypothetical protein
VIITGIGLSGAEVATVARRLRAAGMGECADQIETAYHKPKPLLSISTHEFLVLAAGVQELLAARPLTSHD